MVYRRDPNLAPVFFLIAINILIYIFVRIAPDALFYLGLQPVSFITKPWTIITSMFVHAGIGHLLANMITLFFFGRFLSILVRERDFLLIYFVGGILGNVCFLLLPPSPLAIAVGASGAIFTLGGALAALEPKLRVFIFPIPMPLPLWVAVIGGFFAISFLPQVAWQAHLGGLVSGLIAGLFFRRRRRFSY